MHDNDDDTPRWPLGGNPAEILAQATERLRAQQEEAKDHTRMRAEYTALVVRRFFDSLDPEQLAVFSNLLAGMANEGKDNYMTATLYGMAIGYTWRNAEGAPLPPSDHKFTIFDHGIRGMEEGLSAQAMDLGVSDLEAPPMGHSLDEEPRDES